MQIFIDESGDEGFKFGEGSSQLFCFAAMVFESKVIANEVEKLVPALRQNLGFAADKEFHFRNESKRTKEAILKMLAAWNFGYFAVVIEKAHLNPREFSKSMSLRIYAAELLVDVLMGSIKKSTLIIDECGGKKTQKSIRRAIQQRARKKENPSPIAAVKFQRSRSCDLLQMADAIASSLNHSFSKANGEGKYHKIVRGRELRLEVWPKMQARE